MKTKLFSTIFILMLQIIEVTYCHARYENKKIDIFHIIYQIIVFITFQLMLWLK